MADRFWTIPNPADWIQAQVRTALDSFRQPAARGGNIQGRSYGAGDISRLTAGWTTTPLNADALVRTKLRTLRARSRDQVAGNDYARRFIQLIQSNVLGAQGVQLESLIADPDGTADTAARKAVETAWKRWGQDHPDVTGTLSWLDLERVLTKTAAQDGELVLRFREGRGAGRWAFQVQVLDPELLDIDLNQDLRDGRKIRTGIELDEWGAPVAYHFLQSSHGDARDEDRVYSGRKYVRIPADQILHKFVPEWVGQRRGIPWTATSLERLKILSAYEEAALVHARTGAQALGFFRKEPGAAGFKGDQDDGSGTGSTVLNLEPGEWNTLPEGVQIDTWDPRYPTGEFAPFTTAILKGISAGLGPAYTSLTQDLQGTSFAGGRMGLLEEREFYRYLQTWISSSLHRPVFLRFLRWALLQELVTLPGNGSPLPLSRYDKFSEHSWRGRRWPWVDPLKDAQAAALMIQNGLTTQSRTMRELGQDPTETWDERATELQEQERRGLRAAPPDTTTAPQAEDDTDDGSAPMAGPRRQAPNNGGPAGGTGND